MPEPLSGDDNGEAMHRFVADLHSTGKSVTGDGVRQTLKEIGRRIPIDLHELPSGTRLFDWVVPEEWNVSDAYIKDSNGRRVLDFFQSNLHVVGNSAAVHGRYQLSELKKHLYTNRDHPDWIPRHSFSEGNEWGLCLSHRQLLALECDEYEVCIDASLRPGHLTYGELLVRGRSMDEVLISCHLCHPALCNDNLSGIAVATALAEEVLSRRRRYAYRFLFVPGAIGSVAWLARNLSRVRRIKHGFAVRCVGDSGATTYKRSRRGDSDIDRAFEYVLRKSGKPYRILPYSPYGYDEPLFSAPGFDPPFGYLMRTPQGQYAEHLTSADDPSFVNASALKDSLSKALSAIDVIEQNRRYVSENPFCLPPLEKYRLDEAGAPDGYGAALVWILSMADGRHSLLDVAVKSELPWNAITHAASSLMRRRLIRVAERSAVARRAGRTREQ